jgi:SAM-dependent methyltransferase
MTYPEFPPAPWGYRLPPNLAPESIEEIKLAVDGVGAASQYGWGHTIDFGHFRKEGLLRDAYLRIAGILDKWAWWPPRLDGMRVADVGCFTGGLSLVIAARGAGVVYAVDEIPEHLAQCELLVKSFKVDTVHPMLHSAYRLNEKIQTGSLDLILLSGVLYHLSDMLVGLYAMRELLRPGGILLVQSNGIDDFTHSYANFGRFVAGRWWQPTGLCLIDMAKFMGFEDVEVRFYEPNNCLARLVSTDREIPFRRGLNWPFENLRDATPRSLDHRDMAPIPFSK